MNSYIKGERKASTHILLWNLILSKKLRFEVKSNKSIIFLSKVTKRVQNPWPFFEFELPPFWTAFLPVSSIKRMPPPFCDVTAHIHQGNKT